MDEKYTVPTMGEHLATIREAIQVFESGAAHNTKMYRTVVAHDQQDRANRLRASLAELERLQAEETRMGMLKASYVTELEHMRKRVAELTQHEAHWKANHDDLAKRNALLMQREDLPVDRIPAHAELVRLQEENAELRADQAEEDTLRDKMAGFLRGVANALKGTPEDLKHHSWHDIVEIAVTRMYELTQAREMMLATHEANADLAAQVQETRKDADEWRNTAIATGTELATVRSAFHVNMLRAFPGKTHEEISAEIARACPTDRVTEMKVHDIEQREGMAKTGYVLQSDDGCRACIVHAGAVRWLEGRELWDVVHPGAKS